jgi:RES domain-containing protein
MIVFRVCDSRFPFLWTAANGAHQRAARWHSQGEGPVQYFADTPAGAWAELLRHEEITDPRDLGGFSARIWAVHLEEGLEAHVPELPLAAMRSDAEGYETCRNEARRLRASGAIRLLAPSAALKPGCAAGYQVGPTGLRRAVTRDGQVIVHFGPLPDAEGWCAAEGGQPPRESVAYVRHYGYR